MRSQSKRQYTCHAITYLQCSKLQQEELFMILENYPQVRGEGGLMSLTRCKRSSPGTESRVGDQPGRLVFVVWLSLAHPGRAPKSRASQ